MKLEHFYESWCIPYIVVLECLLMYVHCRGKDDIKKGWQTCGERMDIGLGTQLRTWSEEKRDTSCAMTRMSRHRHNCVETVSGRQPQPSCLGRMLSFRGNGLQEGCCGELLSYSVGAG